MEIFPLKGSWLAWDRNPSKTELLERIRTALFRIFYVSVYVYIILHCIVIPKAKSRAPLHLLGVLIKDQFPPTSSLGAMRQRLPGHLSGEITASMAFLLQEALRDGENSPCPQSSGFAWQLQSLLSTRHV